MNIRFPHATQMTNNLSFVKTGDRVCPKYSDFGSIEGMKNEQKPYQEIANRILWHRELMGLTQHEYARKIGHNRSSLNNWESGDYRLSLDGALSLRKTFGLSLDFMYEGIDDALPMTLRNAWSERSQVK